ncbi:putative LRR receptor-like serine/threonine-protein kinase [Hibiscus syriacus]|uniref:LRR receptor-like serine/threonine-protein kinase n=1 Tax=Hibiscus syriacus TaxID=106335 RepID=A0A6A3BNR6_HIBSY|nr:putative LRR receptor-like serine/threonine-protein kinase [Hibiscus syriacus]
MLVEIRTLNGQPCVRALASFKEAIYEDPNLVFSNWNDVDADPCGWTGITCTKERQHVIKINISDSSLKGFLAPEIGRITYLQELTLRKNNLIGTIPEELGLLNFFELLDLGMNHLTGIIPPELGNLTSVSNGLTGSLPSELGNLKFLQELILDRNKLQGTVPSESNSSSVSKIHGMIGSGTKLTGLCRASQLKVVDLSFNFFVGSIPKCLENLPSMSFQGNCLQGKEAKQRPLTQCGPQPTRSHKSPSPKHSLPKAAAEHLKQKASKPTWLLALEIATGIMVGCLFLVAVLTAFQRCYSKPAIIIPWKKPGREKEHLEFDIVIFCRFGVVERCYKFGRQDLEVACEDFSNIVGSSPDSVVYKGTMKCGPEIAVISFCVKEQHWTGYLELYFQREVADLARLNHENVGKLLGYCKDSSPFTRMLVFEYASNGTLYEHLHYGEGSQLSWTRRMRIILGIARGLMYLHTELVPPFTISELTSSAVYLTEDFSPKVYLLPSLVISCLISNVVLDIRLTMINISLCRNGSVCLLPNSLESRHLDIQGNIHDFGIVLLEIISGKPPFCKEKGCLIDWAKEYLELPEVMSYIVDPELKHFS